VAMMTELSLWHDTFSSQSANGTVEEVQLGGVMAHVAVRVGENLVENVITRRSAEAMALKKGDSVKVVMKSTEVMLQKD
jgi:molybdopterin-binding protein